MIENTTSTIVFPGEVAFLLHTTHGFSLTDLLSYILNGDHPAKGKKVIIGWSGWFKAARNENRKNGSWDFNKAKDVIQEAIVDSLWPDNLDNIIRYAWNEAAKE